MGKEGRGVKVTQGGENAVILIFKLQLKKKRKKR